MFLLRCPNCRNTMKYQSSGLSLVKKRKRCVYCGKSFKVNPWIIKQISG